MEQVDKSTNEIASATIPQEALAGPTSVIPLEETEVAKVDATELITGKTTTTGADGSSTTIAELSQEIHDEAVKTVTEDTDGFTQETTEPGLAVVSTLPDEPKLVEGTVNETQNQLATSTEAQAPVEEAKTEAEEPNEVRNIGVQAPVEEPVLADEDSKQQSAEEGAEDNVKSKDTIALGDDVSGVQVPSSEVNDSNEEFKNQLTSEDPAPLEPTKEADPVGNFLNKPLEEDIQVFSDDDIIIDEESSSSGSSSSSDSDSDSDSSDDEAEKAAHIDLDDDEGDSIAGPITSVNEITDEVAPGLPEGYTVPENAPIECVGEVIALVEQSMIIKANTSGEFRVLKDESILCFQDKTVIGPLCETFGRLQLPVYRVKFNTVEDFEKFKDTKGQSVYYVVPDSHFVYTDSFKNLKGTDASNCHDEELPEEEQEYSDDEQELAAKQARKKKKQNKSKDKDATDTEVGSKNRKRNTPTSTEPAKRFQAYNYAEPISKPAAEALTHPSQAYKPLHQAAPLSFQQLRQGQSQQQFQSQNPQIPLQHQQYPQQQQPQFPTQQPQYQLQQQQPEYQQPLYGQHQQQQHNYEQQYPQTFQPVNEFNAAQSSPYGVPFSQAQHGYYQNGHQNAQSQYGHANFSHQTGQINHQGQMGQNHQLYQNSQQQHHLSSIASGNGQITSQSAGPIGQPTDPYQQEQLQKLQQLILNQMNQSQQQNNSQ